MIGPFFIRITLIFWLHIFFLHLLGFLTIPKPSTNNGGASQTSEEMKNLAKNNTEEKQVTLKKSVDLFSGIALIVGTMIGSGIFVSPTGLLERTGSITYSLLVWGLCGLVSMFGKLKLIFYRVFMMFWGHFK